MPTQLSSNRYGKHRVRVSKVRRPRQAPPNQERHEFSEMAVDVELEGDFDAAFTAGDNRQVIATDTCKNTVYAVAKRHPVDTPESFALAIAKHFLDQYGHVSHCRVAVSQRVWERLGDSPHCFSANDPSTPTATVEHDRGASPRLTSGLKGLLIAKTTESGFTDFHSDEYRTLADTEDRIFATELSAEWRCHAGESDYSGMRKAIVGALAARFTDHYSRSVQETLYFMGQAALDACPPLESISLTMPNKHHLLANLTPVGTENDNEVFVVTDEPFGYITGTVERS